MRTIGLIGGMSWESSAEYYRVINELVKTRLGGLHSAECVMYSVDFAPIEAMQFAGAWDEASQALAAVAQKVERGGADFVLLCTNTMHKVAATLTDALTVPLIHIADPTAEAIAAAGIRTVGLLGTRFTMEEAFYRGRLTERFGLEVLTPDEADRETVHRIIYDELVLGIIRPESRAAYREVIARLVAHGAQGIILGCTEITLLVRSEDATVPLFDTTALHAARAVALALAAD